MWSTQIITGKKGENNMSKFWIQLLALFVFIFVINHLLFAGLIDEISQTATGTALLMTFWLALGWYWGRICNYVETKIRNLVTHKE